MSNVRSLSRDAISLSDGPAWLLAKRIEAFEAAMAVGVPDESNELWRYSPIADLNIEDYSTLVPSELARDDTAIPPSAKAFIDTLITAMGSTVEVIICLNGMIIPYDDYGKGDNNASVAFASLSSSPDSFKELSWSGYRSANDRYPDYFAALNPAFLNDALSIEVSPGSVLPSPILIVHVIDHPSSLVFDRIFVHLRAGSGAAVVELFYSPAEVDALIVPVTEISLEEGSTLDYVNIQNMGGSCTQIGYQVSRLERDAHLNSLNASFGGGYTRVRTDCSLEGDSASSKLLAVYFAAEEQVMDFRTLQRHQAPRTNSDLLFKGAVAGSSRSIYTGLIHMQKGSSGSEAFQTNRNLVLSEGAHADSVPNLEIEENDVKCSHASAVGPVDDEQRYYLETRGIPPAEADRLIVLGFFDDAIGRTPIPGVGQSLQSIVSEKLAQHVNIVEMEGHDLE